MLSRAKTRILTAENKDTYIFISSQKRLNYTVAYTCLFVVVDSSTSSKRPITMKRECLVAMCLGWLLVVVPPSSVTADWDDSSSSSSSSDDDSDESYPWRLHG